MVKYYYYHKSKKQYVIIRHFNGKSRFFGGYKSEEEAKLAVELLDKYGWDKDNVWKIRAEVRETFFG